MAEPESGKLYYSISQVAEITQLDPHVLRYWETEFRELSPRKNRGGKRLYRESDIKLLMQIKELLYERRFTIEGARRELRESKIPVVKGGALPAGDLARELREGLIELRRLIEA